MSTAGADTGIPIGVYRSAEPNLAAIEDYETRFLGMPAGTTANFVLSFMADRPSPAEFARAALQNGTNGPAGPHSATEWGPLLGPRQLMLAVPACIGGTSWAQEAAGVNDANWRALTATLVNAGLGTCTLRIAREFNGGWYPWSVTPATATAHQAGWAHIVTVMRAGGFTGQFCWNPYLTQGTFKSANQGAENAWPGDPYVNRIGMDFYDGGYPPGEMLRAEDQERAVWAAERDAWDGLSGWAGFARNHGKPLGFPEWGLHLWDDGATYSGGGDNALFITEMAAWMRNWAQNGHPWMHALWEDPGMGVADPDTHPRRVVAAPQARAAFLANFGYNT